MSASREDKGYVIRPARTAQDYEAALALTMAYVQWLGIDLSFQGWQDEVETWPGHYSPPHGEALVAWSVKDPNIALGSILLRASPWQDGDCEMKRLYVSSLGRNLGIGKALVAAIVDTARAHGYKRMVLDSLSYMKTAVNIYTSMGFVPIEKYYENPNDGVLYFALVL